jgi:hypothetical protein
MRNILDTLGIVTLVSFFAGVCEGESLLTAAEASVYEFPSSVILNLTKFYLRLQIMEIVPRN